MVLLFTKGLAQNPIDRMNSKGMIRKNNAALKLISSPNQPTIKGTIAPPAIPVHKIPERDPW